MEERNAPYHTQLNGEAFVCCPEYVFVFIDEDNDTIMPREISEDYEDIYDLITSQ